jgi:hypothetical protein
MLAKKTVKNQITLPKKVAILFPKVDYFEIKVHDGKIIMSPVQTNRLEALRNKLSRLGIGENDIRAAVKWARKQ